MRRQAQRQAGRQAAKQMNTLPQLFKFENVPFSHAERKYRAPPPQTCFHIISTDLLQKKPSLPPLELLFQAVDVNKNGRHEANLRQVLDRVTLDRVSVDKEVVGRKDEGGGVLEFCTS